MRQIMLRNLPLESIIHEIQRKLKNLILECLYCDFKGTYQELSSHELVKCWKRPVKCLHYPSNSCSLEIPILQFCELDNHILTDCDGMHFARGKYHTHSMQYSELVAYI